MSLIRGRNGKCPCPICIVPLDSLDDLSQVFPLRNMTDAQEALDVYDRSRSDGEEVLKALGLRPVQVFYCNFTYQYTNIVLCAECILDGEELGPSPGTEL